mmetsp:Transcript_18719/g.33918  ORF Transcript_18719/g.33918 Transcript_18719/m.33918 type:complete len:173 (-) Transcript_18719:365-883(-)
MGCCSSREVNENANLDYSKTHQFQMVTAIKGREVGDVVDLIEEGFVIDFRMPRFNYCAILHKAAEFKAKEIVEEVFKLKPDLKVDIEDSGGLTPLFYAVKAKDWDIMKFLLKKGANVNHKTKYHTKLEDVLPTEEKLRSKQLQDLKLKGYTPKEDSNMQRETEDFLFDEPEA